MTPEQALQRAEEAKRLLETPLIKETLTIMEREVIEAFAACPARDTEGLRILQAELRRVRKFRDMLIGVMESGKIAQEQLRTREPLAKRFINAIR